MEIVAYYRPGPDGTPPVHWHTFLIVEKECVPEWFVGTITPLTLDSGVTDDRVGPSKGDPGVARREAIALLDIAMQTENYVRATEV